MAAVSRRAGMVAVLAALAAPLAQAAPELLAQIGAQLGQHAVVRARFVQTRQMQALKRPVISRGRMVFVREEGVLWLIDEPLQIGYLLSDQRVIERSADGQRREQDARNNPATVQVGRLMRAMLGAQTDALRDTFDVQVQGSPSQWDMTLTPRQTQLAQFIKTLRVSGGRFVDLLRIEERSGDVTSIRFLESQSANASRPTEWTEFLGTP